MASSPSHTSPFSAAQAGLLALLLQQMLDNGGGSVPAIKFRSDHYEQKQILNSLESDGWIRRDQDQYHVRAVTLPLLETEAARQLMQSIEKLFAALRTQYRGTQTAPVKVDALATLSGESREVASVALRMMLDATLWWSGCSTDLGGAEAFVSPKEEILDFTTFAQLAEEIRSWPKALQPVRPTFSVLDALRESEGAMPTPKVVNPMREIKLTNGTWTILEDRRLGSPGGFAAVFLGLSPRNEPVAIKVFHTTDPAKSKRELTFADVRIGRQDPHVISVLDCGVDTETGRACIVMPRAEYSLAQWLVSQGPLEEAAAVVIGHAVVSGLLSANEWVHRDLKPDNLLWCNGRWQITDFGIARQAGAATARSTMKDYMSVHYAAPEQWDNERATHKTDVYALGCLLQEVMAGEPPFAGPEWADFAQQHRSETPTGLAGSPRMKTMLSRMLAKSADARPDLGELEMRFKDWENAAPQTPAAQGLAALAAKLAGYQMQQHAEEASAAQKMRSRAMLEVDAQRELKDLGDALFDRISHMAANAIVDVGQGPTPSMSASLGVGQIWLSVGQFKGVVREQFSNSKWDVICGATVSVAQKDGFGRSASLWYVRRWPNTPYEWVEVSYWNQSRKESWKLEPCLLSPGSDADYAAAPIMHSWVFAHPPISITGEGREPFIERWLTRFTAVAAGAYQRPSMLPESQ